MIYFSRFGGGLFSPPEYTLEHLFRFVKGLDKNFFCCFGKEKLLTAPQSFSHDQKLKRS